LPVLVVGLLVTVVIVRKIFGLEVGAEDRRPVRVCRRIQEVGERVVEARPQPVFNVFIT
jgi:hypothetical protein